MLYSGSEVMERSRKEVEQAVLMHCGRYEGADVNLLNTDIVFILRHIPHDSRVLLFYMPPQMAVEVG